MAIAKVLILGAGPAGLSAALALSKLSTDAEPLEIHVFELRSQPQPIGSSVNLTPLALRYLDHLGAGAGLRRCGVPVRAVDIVSFRSGRQLGSMWGGVDAMRARRADVVEALLEVLRENAPAVCLRMGMRVIAIREKSGGDKVSLEFEGGEVVDGDLLLGCDGLHSAARTLYVDPHRPKTYTGSAVAHGLARLQAAEKTSLRLSDGRPALRDTTVVVGGRGALLATYFEQSRETVCLTAVANVSEVVDESVDSWRTLAGDQDAIKRDVGELFRTSGVEGIVELVENCDRWSLLPVYTLPLEGAWHKGRVLLLGDAAHAVRLSFPSVFSVTHQPSFRYQPLQIPQLI